jgi:prolyl-tRNA synthetase
MKQSQLFTKTRKEPPKDEVSHNAILLMRAGYIYKEMAGVYALLPLGLRVARRVENIIREEMNAIGAQEVLLTTLQDPEKWKRSGRWASEDENKGGLPWFKTHLSSGSELGIANTHEEALATILSQHVSSYKDLPAYVYQFQTKFRNELRAKSGLMRGREFVMKDMYSFTRSQDDLGTFYEKVADAYMRVFGRVGIGEQTYRTFASGGAFSQFSDEFQTLSDAGEDTIYVDMEKRIAVNKEVHTDDVLAELSLDKKTLVEKKAIEVGNIFKLGTTYADSAGLAITDEKGERQPVWMGSYGIGVGRIIGTVAELCSDDMGLVWPASIAPFQAHLVSMCTKDADIQTANRAYEDIAKRVGEVLFDDRTDVHPGIKLAESDLLGMPLRIIISPKTIAAGVYECVNRASGKVTMVPVDSLETHIREVQ